MSACCPPAPECFYCDSLLSPRHEHDHWPVAKRHEGAETVAVCLNCHDLKDRFPLNAWPSPEVVAKAFRECGPLGRILVAKCAGILADRRQLDEAAS